MSSPGVFVAVEVSLGASLAQHVLDVALGRPEPSGPIPAGRDLTTPDPQRGEAHGGDAEGLVG